MYKHKSLDNIINLLFWTSTHDVKKLLESETLTKVSHMVLSIPFRVKNIICQGPCNILKITLYFTLPKKKKRESIFLWMMIEFYQKGKKKNIWQDGARGNHNAHIMGQDNVWKLMKRNCIWNTRNLHEAPCLVGHSRACLSLRSSCSRPKRPEECEDH